VLPKLRGLGRLSPEPSLDPNSSATRFAVSGFRGVVALIAPMTRPFCRKCNRIRLTADGRLRACLIDAGEVDARHALSGGADAEAVRELIEKTMTLKPRRHSERFRGAMARIGG
jgi:cyclic pyranopterin phosphate synthase